MTRPNPIQYAERLYAAIRAANFSPISFLAFGNAIKDGVAMRNMPRIAAEPFMRVVGEMLDLEEESAEREVIEAGIGGLSVECSSVPAGAASPSLDNREGAADGQSGIGSDAPAVVPEVVGHPDPDR